MTILQYKEHLSDLNSDELQNELNSVKNIRKSSDEVKYKTDLILSYMK